MTSFTKPEVHNVSHCRQKRTATATGNIYAENLVKFERVVFEICQRRDKQTDTLMIIWCVKKFLKCVTQRRPLLIWLTVYRNIMWLFWHSWRRYFTAAATLNGNGCLY